jgi:hypothetical protein
MRTLWTSFVTPTSSGESDMVALAIVPSWSTVSHWMDDTDVDELMIQFCILNPIM